MNPPFFTTVNVTAVRAVFLEGSELRVYPFGDSPQNGNKPYAVWQTISGSPENYLGGLPDMDNWVVQVDVYAEEVSDANDGAEVLRDALEPVAYITAWRGTSREPETRLYRYSFDVEFQTPR